MNKPNFISATLHPAKSEPFKLTMKTNFQPNGCAMLNNLAVQNKSVYIMLNREIRSGSGFHGITLPKLFSTQQALNFLYTKYISTSTGDNYQKIFISAKFINPSLEKKVQGAYTLRG